MNLVKAILMALAILVMPAQVQGQPSTIVWEQVQDGYIEAVAWNSLGSHIAFGATPSNPTSISVLELETSSITPMHLPGAELWGQPVWSPDGQTLAVATGSKLFLLNNETHVVTTVDLGMTGTIAWSLDSSQIYIYTTDDLINDEVYTYDVTTAAVNLFLQGPTHGANRSGELFDLTPNGQIFAFPNDETHSIGFWDDQGELLEDLSQNAFEQPERACAPAEDDFTSIDAIAWSADSSVLALGSYSGLDLCELTGTRSIAVRHIDATPTYTVAWSPNGRYLASGTFQWVDLGVGCEIRLFEVMSDYEKLPVPIDEDVCSVFSIAWSPDSQHVVVGTNHGLWLGSLGGSAELP